MDTYALAIALLSHAEEGIPLLREDRDLASLCDRLRAAGLTQHDLEQIDSEARTLSVFGNRPRTPRHEAAAVLAVCTRVAVEVSDPDEAMLATTLYPNSYCHARHFGRHFPNTPEGLARMTQVHADLLAQGVHIRWSPIGAYPPK